MEIALICGGEEINCDHELVIDLFAQADELIEESVIPELCSEKGWLYINEDTVYCPICRKTLHD
jgi:hypothetical protein